MPFKNIHENIDFLIEVEHKEKRLKHLFQVAARTTVSTERTDRELFEDDTEVERMVSLFWFHFTKAQLQLEPRNDLLQANLAEAQSRVNAAFLTDDQHELKGIAWEGGA